MHAAFLSFLFMMAVGNMDSAMARSPLDSGSEAAGPQSAFDLNEINGIYRLVGREGTGACPGEGMTSPLHVKYETYSFEGPPYDRSGRGTTIYVSKIWAFQFERIDLAEETFSGGPTFRPLGCAIESLIPSNRSFGSCVSRGLNHPSYTNSRRVVSSRDGTVLETYTGSGTLGVQVEVRGLNLSGEALTYWIGQAQEGQPLVTTRVCRYLRSQWLN